MLQAFVITLREGLEAFLIVAISLAYLKKTGRRALIPAVHWGIAGSVVLSIVAGLLFAQASNQALWEGVLALVAAVLVASLTVHMWRAGKRMKKDIEARLEESSARLGRVRGRRRAARVRHRRERQRRARRGRARVADERGVLGARR